MNRRQFRRARVAALCDMHCTHDVHADMPGYAAAQRLLLDTRYDRLAARLGGFATDARSRITLYPLRAA